MKILKVWLIIMPMFTIACSNEYAVEITETAHMRESSNKSEVGPENSANPFDSAGSIHNEILEILEQTDFTSMPIQDITILVDSVSAAHSELALFSNNITFPTPVSEITWIINNNDVINEVLVASNLTTTAKTNLLTFINSLPLTTADTYEDIHSVIISYEDNIISDNELTNADKKTILTTTSVLRYSTYRKRKDKDWETSITSIAATISGVEQSTYLGIKMAVIVEIYQKNNIIQ